MLLRLFILLALSTACSPDLDLDRGERVKSAETESSFQSECVLVNGSIACQVKYEDTYIKLDHPELELTPQFAAYQFSDISIISPADLDIKDSFLSLKSPIEKKSEYTLVLSFLDEVSVFDFFDNVIVNDDDPVVKKNRLELIQMMCKTFNNYVNFALIDSRQ